MFWATSTARALERENQTALLVETYRCFADVFAKSKDTMLAGYAESCAATVRRLSLLGNYIEVTGVGLSGAPFDWAQYHGRCVLVHFWAASSAACRAEIAHIRSLYALYHGRGLDVVGINLDANRQELDGFLKTDGVPWANLYEEGKGTKHPMALRYGVTAVPTTFLVGKDGKVVLLQAGGPELDRLLEQLLGPALSPKGNLTPIDFQSKANRRLNEKFGRIEGNDLRELPQGEQTLGGLKFKIGPAALFLAGAKYREVPEKIEGIAVDRTIARLHVLHGAAWADAALGVPDRTEIGTYVVHYEDGSQQVIPIVCGENVSNWWSSSQGGKPLPRGKVLWTGANPATRGGPSVLQLYLITWENPHPEAQGPLDRLRLQLEDPGGAFLCGHDRRRPRVRRQACGNARDGIHAAGPNDVVFPSASGLISVA